MKTGSTNTSFALCTFRLNPSPAMPSHGNMDDNNALLDLKQKHEFKLFIINDREESWGLRIQDLHYVWLREGCRCFSIVKILLSYKCIIFVVEKSPNTSFLLRGRTQDRTSSNRVVRAHFVTMWHPFNELFCSSDGFNMTTAVQVGEQVLMPPQPIELIFSVHPAAWITQDLYRWILSRSISKLNA